MQTITRTIGDTLKPIAVRLCNPNGNPEDLTGETVKFKMVAEDRTVIQAATTDRVTNHPTKAFTADASTDRLTADDHGIKDGWQVKLSSSGTLPAPLSSSVWYHATQTTDNTLQLSLLPNGTVIDITDAGSGTHTLVVRGHVQYDPTSANMATVGTYYAWFQIVDGTETDTFPGDGRTFRIDLVEAA